MYTAISIRREEEEEVQSDSGCAIGERRTHHDELSIEESELLRLANIRLSREILIRQHSHLSNNENKQKERSNLQISTKRYF